MVSYFIVFCVVAICIGSAVTLLMVIYEWLEGLWTRFVRKPKAEKPNRLPKFKV
jgi:hypothetical protein